MITETSTIKFGGTRLAYGVRRSSRRKTVAVAVDPDDGVLLTAPENVPLQKLDEVVRSRATWILERLRWVEQAEPRRSPREFVSGESFLYLGRTYRLRVAPPSAKPSCRLEAGFFVVAPARSQDRSQRARSVRALLEGWFRDRAAERLPERVAVWRERVGVGEVGQVLVRAQHKRWASCDAAGNLRFNWRVMQAPMKLVDYVVAHELTHLVHADHTPDFWRRLGRAMPDYDKRRRDLRLLGPAVDW